MYYKEGQLVHKGQPLLEIDPRPYQATLLQVEGTLKRDQGVLSQAQIDLARYEAAYARNAIAKQQLDDQQQIVLQDQGTVQADQGNVDYDKVQLAYCHIVSPITGRVGLRLVDPGNTVFSGAGTTLAVITQVQPITVVFNVSEDALPQIQDQLHTRRALPVDAYDRSNDKKIETGRLTSLDNIIDTSTGTVKFRANFDNKGLVLFPNQFVNARLLVKTLENVTPRAFRRDPAQRHRRLPLSRPAKQYRGGAAGKHPRQQRPGNRPHRRSAQRHARHQRL